MLQDVANKVFSKVNKIISDTTDSYRKSLDANIHVLDLSFEALSHSSSDLTREDYSILLVELRKAFKSTNSLKRVMSVIKDPSTVTGYGALVEDPEFGIYLVASSYKALQTKISGILKNLDLKEQIFTGRDDSGKTVANIGHIPSSELPNLRSPLSAKILTALRSVPLAAQNTILVELNNLYNSHTLETEYQFQRPDFKLDEFQKILGKSTLLVTLQTADRNNAFATSVEAAINKRITAYCASNEFLQLLVNIPGSNTILEDIKEALVATLKGKQSVAGSKHSKKPASTSKTKVSGKGKLGGIALPQLRTTEGRYFSLTLLLGLLNQKLPKQITENMGGGDRKDILNYRSGVFANTVEVDRLTQSRQGMITAFYSYMKSPYQTFEPGWAQGHIKSRDPKLLISKSIREIGATMVNNRMRAVLV